MNHDRHNVGLDDSEVDIAVEDGAVGLVDTLAVAFPQKCPDLVAALSKDVGWLATATGIPKPRRFRGPSS